MCVLMRKEYKKSIEKIIRANKLHNNANPLFKRNVSDAQYDLEFNVLKNCWDLKNKRKITSNISVENIIIVLESPHIDEFDQNGNGLYPLMNDELFKQHLCKLINNSKKLQFTLNKQIKYIIYLINAIQFQCSLGQPTEYYRDFVFLYYWKKLYKDFEQRLSSYINFNTKAIINLCTKGSHKKCYNLYNSVSKKIDYVYKSCCNSFINKIYSQLNSCNNLQELVGVSIDNVIKNNTCQINITEGTHPSSWRYGGKIK